MRQPYRLLAGAISVLLLLVSAITASAAPPSPGAQGAFRMVRLAAPQTVRMASARSRHGAAAVKRPKLKRPFLAKNAAALAAAKAAAQRLIDGSAARSTLPQRPRLPGTLPALTGSALETLTSFPGMGLEQQIADMGRNQTGEPADTQVAVGPNHVVEAVNANLSTWTKSGARLDTFDLQIFFSLGAGFSFSDPNIVYDAGSQRWFLSGTAFNSASDSFLYAATSQTSDPGGTWYTYTIASSPGVLMDQPQLGYSDDKVVLAWADFAPACNPSCLFKGEEVYVLQKSDMVAAIPPHAAVSGPDTTRFGIIPVRSLTSTTNQYLVYNNADATNLVQNKPGPTAGLIKITGTPASAIQSMEVDLPIQSTTLPPEAQQPDGVPPLQTDDDRFQTAIWQNGTLWTAANEGCPTATPGACLRVLRFDTGTSTVQPGVDLGGAADFLYYPAMTLDSSGNPFVTYTESNAGLYPSMVMTRIAPGATPVALIQGTASVNTKVCGGTNRWGDYAGAAVDPTDPQDVWVAGGYGASSNDPCDWRTAIGRITLSAPTITGFSPTVVPQAGGTLVHVTGSDFVPGYTSVNFPGGLGTGVTVISPHELTAVTPASGTTSGAVTVTTPDGTTASSGAMTTVPYRFGPAPIAPNGVLTSGQAIPVDLIPNPGQPSFLSFSGAGTACAMGSGSLCIPLTTMPVQYQPGSNGQIQIRYNAPIGALPTSGSDTIHVQDAATAPTSQLDDTYTFTPVVTQLIFAFAPLEPEGDLVAGTSVNVTVTAKAGVTPVPGTTVYLSFVRTGGGGFASSMGTELTTTAMPFMTDANGQIAVVYSTPGVLPTAGGTDTITATTANGTARSQTTYVFPPVTTFYFAEGFTGAGFAETLSLLMPNENGTAVIDYYTQSGHTRGFAFLSQGTVEPVDVNAAVGATQQVSVKVTFPGPGVAERTLHFSFGSWHGSTDKVGATQASTQWNFAEGSTLAFFSEYLTLQNPNFSQATTTLNYFTDSGGTATKTLTLPGNSRTTVEVFNGDLTPATCAISGGVAVNCGVGRGIGGVSVQVVSTDPIIAERPFYVNNFSFGSGAIRDGHDAFGATAPSTQWNFAEGTTLSGFNEYLTLENPTATAAVTQLHYFTDAGRTPVKTLTVPANRRVTVEVFTGDLTTNTNCVAGGGGTCGVGPGVGGVSVQVTSTQPIVAERPLYTYHNFGTGIVAGAHVVMGATALNTLFGFAWGSTAGGDNDFLTIQNPGAVTAHLTITYFGPAGGSVRTVDVLPSTRHTVQVFLNDGEGAGPGLSPLGIVVQSTQAILVEKPTYSSNAATYGATDTLGFSPAGF